MLPIRGDNAATGIGVVTCEPYAPSCPLRQTVEDDDGGGPTVPWQKLPLFFPSQTNRRVATDLGPRTRGPASPTWNDLSCFEMRGEMPDRYPTPRKSLYGGWLVGSRFWSFSPMCIIRHHGICHRGPTMGFGIKNAL